MQNFYHFCDDESFVNWLLVAIVLDNGIDALQPGSSDAVRWGSLEAGVEAEEMNFGRPCCRWLVLIIASCDRTVTSRCLHNDQAIDPFSLKNFTAKETYM